MVGYLATNNMALYLLIRTLSAVLLDTSLCGLTPLHPDATDIQILVTLRREAQTLGFHDGVLLVPNERFLASFLFHQLSISARVQVIKDSRLQESDRLARNLRLI